MGGRVALALAGDGVRCQLGVEDALEESRLFCPAWLAAMAWQSCKGRHDAIPTPMSRCRGVEFACSWELLGLNDGALLEELVVEVAVLEPLGKPLAFELTLALRAAVVGCEEMSWVQLRFCSWRWRSS